MDYIFEIIDCVLLGVKLVPVEGDGDVVEGLMDEQADVQFKSDGGEIGNLIQRFKRLMGLPPRIFFHEYGRRVGMVPRSSLKEGKNNQMVEKGTKTPKPTKPNTQARRPKLHHLVVFPLH